MYLILYSSETSWCLTDDEIMIMLKKARNSNHQRLITGMLLYSEKIFIQILEGPKKQVETTFQKINNDPRHKNIRLILSKDIDQRNFPEWDMGFKWISNEDFKKIKDIKDETIKSYLDLFSLLFLKQL